jgi:hypothetical protein
MRKRDVAVFGGLLLAAAAALTPSVLWGYITSGEVVNAIILMGLVIVTTMYVVRTNDIAKATQEQAREAQMARFASLHPVLSVVPEAPFTDLPHGKWLGRPGTVSAIGIRIVNFGTGPAVNGILSVCAGPKTLAKWRLPTLGPEWGHITQITAVQGRDDVTLLRLSYEDVFGYRHVTSYNARFANMVDVELGDEIHHCLYHEADSEEVQKMTVENQRRVDEVIQTERRLLPRRLLVYLTTSSLLFLGFVTSESVFIQRVVAGLGLFTCFVGVFHFFGIYLRLGCLEKLREMPDSEKRKGFLKAFSGRVFGLVWFPLIFVVLWSLSLASTIFHWR